MYCAVNSAEKCNGIEPVGELADGDRNRTGDDTEPDLARVADVDQLEPVDLVAARIEVGCRQS